MERVMQLIETARDAAREAGRLLQKYFRSGVEVRSKAARRSRHHS
jgi:hypothetical protein